MSFKNGLLLLSLLVSFQSFGMDDYLSGFKKVSILHRLKGETKRGMLKEYFKEDSVQNVIECLEQLDVIYDPSRFSIEKKHHWKGNYQWLKAIVQKFDTSILTDLPLRRENVVRSGKDTENSAYAREIAYLLLQGFRPVPDNLMVNQHRLNQLHEMGIEIPSYILSDLEKHKLDHVVEGKFVSSEMLLYIFYRAGLPTNLKEDQIEELRMSCEKYSQAFEKTQDRLQTKMFNKMNPVQKTVYDIDDDLLKEVALEYLEKNSLGALKKSFFDPMVIKELKNLAIEKEAIPEEMGNNRFKDHLMKVLNLK